MEEVLNKEDYFTTEEFDNAVILANKQPMDAAKILKSIVAGYPDEDVNKTSRMKEEAIYLLGRIYAKSNSPHLVKELMISIRPFFDTVSKPRGAKILRTLIDKISETENSGLFLVEVIEDSIKWCQKENRTFLKQRLQAKLAGVLCEVKRYKESLLVIRQLTREIKKLDDKPLMVDISLIESNVYFMLQNIPKAKGALTSARSNANGFYCPPLLQASIDFQAGILCSAENDFKTAFSYFYEAFEGYNGANDANKSVLCLKYMLLSKVMGNQSADVYNIVSSKAGLKYAGIDLEAVKQVADAYKKRSLTDFKNTLNKYKDQLQSDPIVHFHLTKLYDTLLENNLLKLLEPYTSVEIDYIAELIELPRKQVEHKLSQMILDKKLIGILDQGTGNLIIYENANEDKGYNLAIKLIDSLSEVTDKLQIKAQKLSKA